jgi:hydrogenase maturation protein HypF
MLRTPTRPIVLLPKRSGAPLSELIAPGMGEVGIMLPYSPLHHLLLREYDRPLVATSANISGEPVLTDPEEVAVRLGRVADAFLHHDRPIQRPADDPVFRPIQGRPRPIRLGRGCAPLELDLPLVLPEPILAVGGHMKNTIALGWENRAIVSPHIGDMGSLRSQTVFEQVIADLQALYQVEARRVACDAHPDYATSRWARRSGLPVTPIFHHHAHAAALTAEHTGERWLVFTWDGVGFGEDGTLWGGEALLGRPGAWQRVASLRPFRLPGGERAAREPWRSAAGISWEAGLQWDKVPDPEGLARAAWERRLNAPITSAVGRLFDAAAALLGIRLHASFEGQGPMELETLAGQCECPGPALPVQPREDGLLQIDWAPLVPFLLDPSRSTGERAAGFHDALAHTMVAVAEWVAARAPFERIGLTGGVFQNRRLTERAYALLSARGFDVRLAEQLPCNDAAISLGQVIEYAARAGRVAGDPSVR